MSKIQQLMELARKRQRETYPGYKNLSDYSKGVYECDYVSPYTKVGGNLNAEIMVVLQDWSSDDAMKESSEIDEFVLKNGRSEFLATNIKLDKLLNEFFSINISETYATNLFPFIKMGNMSARIPIKDMKRAAEDFALPQIEIIKPKLVICIGKHTFDAIRIAAGESNKITKNMAEAMQSFFWYKDTLIYCQAHTGNWGQNGRNKSNKGQVHSDWEKMKQIFTHHQK